MSMIGEFHMDFPRSPCSPQYVTYRELLRDSNGPAPPPNDVIVSSLSPSPNFPPARQKRLFPPGGLARAAPRTWHVELLQDPRNGRISCPSGALCWWKTNQRTRNSPPPPSLPHGGRTASSQLQRQPSSDHVPDMKTMS
jgi:hypothetical protein